MKAENSPAPANEPGPREARRNVAARSRGQWMPFCTLLAAAMIGPHLTGQAIAAEADPATILIVQAGEGGPVTDLVPFEALVGGKKIETATDFGFLQKSDDGFAIRAVRTRVGVSGLRTLDCTGGLAPAMIKGVFEGAYVCGEERPVPVSYQPLKRKLLPNMIDPNGVWEGEGFFVSSILSMKVQPVKGVTLPESTLRPLSDDVPGTLTGAIGRVSPPRVQKSGACGDDIAVFFPLAALPACADAAIFDQE